MPESISWPSLSDYDDVRRRLTREVSSRPLVSVVTVCFNAANSIERTIESVFAQSVDVEYIVVDGGSTDDTVQRARQRLRSTDLLVTEKDGGISDAMNKGIALANGEFVQLIHADDWMSPDQLARAVGVIRDTGADYVFGDLIFYEGGEASFRYKGDPDYVRSIHRLCPAINHPTVLARRQAYERFGLYSLELKRAMDYEWYCRLHRAGGRGVYSSSIIASMNHDGVSNMDFRGTMEEVRRIAVAYGRSPVVAELERSGRVLKTRLGRALKRVSKGTYGGLRRSMNKSVDVLKNT